jgi:hypothetical protein
MFHLLTMLLMLNVIFCMFHMRYTPFHPFFCYVVRKTVKRMRGAAATDWVGVTRSDWWLQFRLVCWTRYLSDDARGFLPVRIIISGTCRNRETCDCSGIWGVWWFTIQFLAFFPKVGLCDHAVCVSVNPPLPQLTFECLNQSLWNLVCISWHLSPSQRRTP